MTSGYPDSTKRQAVSDSLNQDDTTTTVNDKPSLRLVNGGVHRRQLPLNASVVHDRVARSSVREN